MKKFLGLATVAALVAGIQTAQAVPTLRLEITSTVANNGCADWTPIAGGAGSTIANGCAFQTTGGLLWDIATTGFAGWAGTVTLKGDPVQPQPAFWLAETLTGFQASDIKIKAMVWDYALPASGSILTSFLGFNLESGNTANAQFFFDGNNGLDASTSGVLVNSLAATSTFATPSIVSFANTNSGQYSMAYIFNLTTTSAGAGFTSSGDGKVTNAPTPAAAAILGLGLLGVGFIRRRVK